MGVSDGSNFGFRCSVAEFLWDDRALLATSVCVTANREK